MALEIPGFKINNKLYESPRTTLYSAIRETDNQPVSLKTFSADYPSREDIARFQHEYRIQKKLDAVKGVVDVFSLEKIGNSHVMVLEYVAGKELSSLSRNGGPVPIDLFFEVALQVTEIIGEIHRQYIIHKDINPQNILWDSKAEQIRIIDFGISTELSREKPSHNTTQLNGSLPYISPEQTGRMNRAIDYRSDFYSLGVTLYKLLTGHFPFAVEDEDPMSWVHSHIARQPLPLDNIKQSVAPALSAILNKLMAKNAEDRYQSAHSIITDLKTCQTLWQKTGAITNFIPAEQDIPNRFSIPQKLFGREREIATLLESFTQTAEGDNTIFLVSGYSGIGKSVLINEIHKPIIARKGFFISGKFDQFQRNIPYYAIAKAFRALMRQLLTESSEKLLFWKGELFRTLGPNGQVLIDLIPELEQIIGPQPAVPHLGTEENQNRFNRLALRFLQLFAQREHPLVMFIDDLQWADSASLNLIRLFMLNREQGYFMLLGAYRDNEVDTHHPLLSTVEDIKKSGLKVPTLLLTPLDLTHINQLISGTVYRDLEQTLPLARLVEKKTNGNPFFINQFLKNIYETDLLRFVPDALQWQWDLDLIDQQQSSDNVVDLVLATMGRLPEQTRNMLRHAACIGNIFELKTLAVITEQSLVKTAQDLWPAVESGLLITEGDNHTLLKGLQDAEHSTVHTFPNVFDRFLHDRVQQAAYSLIDDDQKQQVHLKIGRLLLQNTAEQELVNNCFDITEHFNKSINLISDFDECYRLAKLNLNAGHKAKDATAYIPALQYFSKGTEYLKKVPGTDTAKLGLTIEKGLLECYFLLNDVKAGIRLAEALLERCSEVKDKVDVNNLLILYYGGAGEMDKAIDIALESLRLFNINLPRNPNMVQLLTELGKAKLRLGRKSDSQLQAMPQIQNTEIHTVFSLLKELIAPTYLQGLTNLLPYIILRMFNLTLQYGNSPVASFTYACYALLWSKLDNFSEAYRFGLLAMDCNQTTDNPPMEARCYFMATSFALYWGQPLNQSREPRATGLQKLIDTGEYFWASYIYLFGFWQEVVLSQSLDELIELTYREIEFASKALQTEPFHVHRLHRNLFKALAGQAESLDTLDDHPGEEEQAIAYFQHNVTSTMGRFYHVVCRLILHYYSGQFDQAVKIATGGDMTSDVIKDGTFTRPMYTFFTCLALLGQDTEKGAQKKHRQTYKHCRQQLKNWYELFPQNFSCMWLLVQAEENRQLGRENQAIECYDKALQEAGNSSSFFYQSLANELYARFWYSLEKPNLASVFMQEAGYLYYRWGAMGKLQLLQEQYQDLFKHRSQLPEHATTRSYTRTTMVNENPANSGNLDTALDIQTLVKASQTLASEIVLDRLLEKLMHFLIENAGAQKGVLILKEEEGLFLEAEYVLNDKDVEFNQQKVALDLADNISVPIVRFVARSREIVLLGDAASDPEYTADSYIKANQSKSLFCLPLVDKNKLTGVLYLENNLASNSFTPDKVKTLEVLSAEMAIALENARLYRNLEKYNLTLEEKVRERTEVLRSTNAALQNKNVEIQKSKQIIEEYNKNITRSIAYAKKIQDAIQPDISKIRDTFPQCFVFFSPKQIVSGDFYWFNAVQDSIFIAVADCTGHGVPGAFLSMIGHMCLNKIVNEQKIVSPGEVLAQLHIEVRKALKQEGKKREAYEGMDIALCRIDRNEKQVIFSGAKRPFYRVKSQNASNRITKIAGNRKSIGGRQKESKRVFTDHPLEYCRGDMIYLCSDGLVDQHNRLDAKFGSTRLEKLLKEMAHLDTDRQNTIILDAINGFRQEESQRDDITLIGLRLD